MAPRRQETLSIAVPLKVMSHAARFRNVIVVISIVTCPLAIFSVQKPVVRRAVATTSGFTDSFHDGTPDFLRLDDPRDVRIFTRWFTLIAETEAIRSADSLPPEIKDCAALARFAYRESLKRHDGQWANELGLQAVAGSGSIGKYTYPRTLLGPGLFRIREGVFESANLTDGTFQQFADAKTISQLNAHVVSRNLRDARPADLLIFRQESQSEPFHLMIFVGRSTLEDSSSPWIVYHTGPNKGHAGEMRRVTVEELMRHPDARWHPAPENKSFLGIYRWNILRGVQQ